MLQSLCLTFFKGKKTEEEIQMTEAKQSFLKRKNIEFTAKRYFQDALSAMALGLFASLLIGLIIRNEFHFRFFD